MDSPAHTVKLEDMRNYKTMDAWDLKSPYVRVTLQYWYKGRGKELKCILSGKIIKLKSWKGNY